LGGDSLGARDSLSVFLSLSLDRGVFDDSVEEIFSRSRLLYVLDSNVNSLLDDSISDLFVDFDTD